MSYITKFVLLALRRRFHVIDAIHRCIVQYVLDCEHGASALFCSLIIASLRCGDGRQVQTDRIVKVFQVRLGILLDDYRLIILHSSHRRPLPVCTLALLTLGNVAPDHGCFEKWESVPSHLAYEGFLRLV